MAQNGITYVGRMINNRDQARFGKSQRGQVVLTITLAEQHTGRNDKVAPKYRDDTKATDAYVPTTTSWHKVTIFGELAEDLIQDPDFNHGALVQVTNAQYLEEDPWTTRDNVQRAGRPETIGKDSKLDIFEVNGRAFVAREEYAKPLWDGKSEIPALKGQGGGGGGGREYSDDEGF